MSGITSYYKQIKHFLVVFDGMRKNIRIDTFGFWLRLTFFQNPTFVDGKEKTKLCRFLHTQYANYKFAFFLYAISLFVV